MICWLFAPQVDTEFSKAICCTNILEKKVPNKESRVSSWKRCRSTKEHKEIPSERNNRTCYWIGCVGVKEMAKIKDDSQVFGLYIGSQLLKWRHLGEWIKFFLQINSDMSIIYPKQYTKMEVRYISLDGPEERLNPVINTWTSST